MPMRSSLTLNPALQTAEYAAAYAEHQFVQIPDLFPVDQAEAITKMVREQLAWKLVFASADGSTVQLSQADVRAMGEEKFTAQMQEVRSLATSNHGFCYNAYQMIQARDSGADPDHPIHDLTAFLNSAEFIEFSSAVTGEQGITNVDAQATLYTRGSFLTRHVDEGHQQQRRAAYTLGLSKDWQTDWGGLLMFLDRQTTDATSAWLPRFNTLTLFDGRKVHAVSSVASFAGEGRYSIAGWLQDN